MQNVEVYGIADWRVEAAEKWAEFVIWWMYKLGNWFSVFALLPGLFYFRVIQLAKIKF